jgi:FkbM family methyltransferase
MKNAFINFLKTCFDSKSGQRFLEKVHLLVLYLQNYGLSGECDSSGEVNALKKASEQLNKKTNILVFDIGANIGKYATNFTKLLTTKYTIHCFEPSPNTFKILKENTKHDANIIPHCLGMGNEETESILFSNDLTNTHSSLLQRDMSHWDESYNLKNKETVSITTLDNFCSKHTIDFIDFMKIDIEGYEWNFFKGAKGTLDAKKIGMIQFELGVGAVDGKYFFKDVFYLLNKNYRIYRITKNNLYEITKYKEQYEIFLTTNYLAILR